MDDNSKCTSSSGILSREAERSIAASSMFPGFRFSPTDEELILYYLKKKLHGFDKCVELIPQLDICKYEPWDLPSKAFIKSEQEWFFFSPRGKKYPNGSQSKRATEIGYWKATGKERGVKSGSNVIGTKRTLVFHIGRAPKGERTDWIMHEYCMSGKAQDALVVCRVRRKCEYHGPNGDSDYDASLLMASSGTNSGCGMDEVVNVGMLSGMDKLGECSFKKSTSSHGSHSVEQMDSACQSDWKAARDEIIVQPESTTTTTSNNHVVNEDDSLFAEILNDSIIQLDDECLPPGPGPSTFGAQSATTVPVNIVPHQPVVPKSYPSQGTANKRIRLRKLRPSSPPDPNKQESSAETMVSSNSKTPKGWIRFPKNCFLYVLVITMALLILIMAYAIHPAQS